jgi:hypothetical protein
MNSAISGSKWFVSMPDMRVPPSNGKARVAVARKLSVILHSVWRSGEPFRWSEHANAA